MKMKLNEKDSIEQIIAILNIVSFDLPQLPVKVKMRRFNNMNLGF